VCRLMPVLNGDLTNSGNYYWKYLLN